MLPADEKEPLSARWRGEAFRESAVLVWVFLPLDWFLGAHEGKLLVGIAASLISACLFKVGVLLGFRGESEAK